jgi:rhodanese-related sulfurtransferase
MQLFIEFLREQWVLWTALAAVAVIYTVTEAMSKARGPKILSALQLTSMMNNENAIVIDMRANNKYIDGHIIGAQLMAESEISADKLKKFQDKNIVFVCENGVKSLMTARKCQSLGIAQLHVLEGGMQGWRGAGMPVIKGKS